MRFVKTISFLLFFVAVVSCSKKQEAPEFAGVFLEKQKEDIPKLAYGFSLNEYHMERDTVKRGDNLSLILARHNYDATEIHDIVAKVKDSFDVRNIRAGKTFTLLKSKEAIPRLEVMIYEPDKTGFQVIDFRDSIHTYSVNYPVTYRTRTIAGEITGSLSASIQKEGLDPGLASLLAKRFAWNIDFF